MITIVPPMREVNTTGGPLLARFPLLLQQLINTMKARHAWRQVDSLQSTFLANRKPIRDSVDVSVRTSEAASVDSLMVPI